MDSKQVETLKIFYPFSLPKSISPCAVGFSGFWAHSCGRHCPLTEHLGSVHWFRATYHFGTPNPHKSHGLSSCSFILRLQTYSNTYSDTTSNIFEVSLGGTVSVMLRRTQWPICQYVVYPAPMTEVLIRAAHARALDAFGIAPILKDVTGERKLSFSQIDPICSNSSNTKIGCISNSTPQSVMLCW